MTEPYYEDSTIRLLHGQAAEVLAGLEVDSVDCCVTSPPYFGLRDYGVVGQIGAEETHAEFIDNLIEVFGQIRRVLADDGTCWVNLGDSYAAKNLLGSPWQFAFAMQDDGWILRNAIVWHKPNAMPESTNDRLSTRYEMLFLFSKSRRYRFDLDPIRENHAESTVAAAARARIPYTAPGQKAQGKTRGMNTGGANPGDVWSISTTPFPGAHFATFPPELARRAIVSGCKPGGTVIDPFSGSGTTGMVALQNGRSYIGIDLSAEYLDLSLRTRLSNGVLDFGDAS